MIKKIKIIGLLLFSLISIYSCVDDDVCDKPTTPRLTLAFLDATTGQPLKINDLYIQKINADGSFSKIGPFSNRDSLRITLNTTTNFTKYCIYEGKDSLSNFKDTLLISYKLEQKFVSKACGFGIWFDQVKYSHNTPAKNIKSIIPKTTKIYNESKNLYILY